MLTPLVSYTNKYLLLVYILILHCQVHLWLYSQFHHNLPEPDTFMDEKFMAITRVSWCLYV